MLVFFSFLFDFKALCTEKTPKDHSTWVVFDYYFIITILLELFLLSCYLVLFFFCLLVTLFILIILLDGVVGFLRSLDCWFYLHIYIKFKFSRVLFLLGSAHTFIYLLLLPVYSLNLLYDE
jgi:hypothetical protein